MKSGKTFPRLLKIHKQVGFDHDTRHTLTQYVLSKYLDALTHDLQIIVISAR